MPDSQLILVEGLTGAGKSTTSQRLWLHLERCGHAARWCYEHDTSHPIWPPGDLQRKVERGAVAPGFHARTLPGRWRRLAAACAAGDARVIVDGALLQTGVGLLLAMNVDERAVAASVRAVERAIAGANPVLVYIRPGDVGEALRAVCDDRRDSDYEAALVALLAATPYGRASGLCDFAGLVRFYERWRDLAESVYACTGMRKVALDAADWPARERRLTDFLGLPPIDDEPLVQVETPSRYVGCYRDAAADGRLDVGADAHGLHLDNPRRTRLIARPDGTFHIAAMCVEVAFRDERAGRFRRLELRGNLPGLNLSWQRDDAPDETPDGGTDAAGGGKAADGGAAGSGATRAWQPVVGRRAVAA